MTGTIVSEVDLPVRATFSNGSTGGLVGFSQGNITTSYAIATVSGNIYVGGLIGQSFLTGSLTESYAIATVSGNTNVGGLVGEAWSRITTSYALATVSGNLSVGGLVGKQFTGDITATYAVAIVAGQDQVGGLIGTGANSIGGHCELCHRNRLRYHQSRRLGWRR